MLHEIRVNGYAAEADGPLDLGTWGSYGTEQLHFTFDADWSHGPVKIYAQICLQAPAE